MDSLPARLSQATPAVIDGVWQRHVAARFADTALTGRSANGRWGTEGSYPVLYLGRPTDSVAVEAYRHLVDPVVTDGDPAPPIRPRALITCEVSVTEILDLRSSTNRALAGITPTELQSETSDRAAYEACQNISAAAHPRLQTRQSARPVVDGVVRHRIRLFVAAENQSGATEPVARRPFPKGLVNPVVAGG